MLHTTELAYTGQGLHTQLPLYRTRHFLYGSLTLFKDIINKSYLIKYIEVKLLLPFKTSPFQRQMNEV